MAGSPWIDIKAFIDIGASDTTLQAQRDEWIDAGVFDRLTGEAVAAFSSQRASLVTSNLTVPPISNVVGHHYCSFISEHLSNDRSGARAAPGTMTAFASSLDMYLTQDTRCQTQLPDPAWESRPTGAASIFLLFGILRRVCDAQRVPAHGCCAVALGHSGRDLRQ